MRASKLKTSSNNEKKKIVGLLSLIFLVLLVLVMVVKKRKGMAETDTFDNPEISSSQKKLFPEVDSTDSIDINQKINAKAEKNEGVGLQSGQKGPEVDSDNKLSKERPGIPLTSDLKKQLNKLYEAQKKVITTPEEENLKKNWLKDPLLIQQMKDLLLSQKFLDHPQFEIIQNTAIEFLKEALNASSEKDDNQIVRQAVLEIVRDAQIENTELSVEDRQKLAAPKIEILFNGVAIRPDFFENIESQLPGPATLQIWKNIQVRQSEMEAESRREASEK